jgi:hypothetical protein
MASAVQLHDEQRTRMAPAHLEAAFHDILDREVFWPSRMVKPEGVPDYEILDALLRVHGASYEM